MNLGRVLSSPCCLKPDLLVTLEVDMAGRVWDSLWVCWGCWNELGGLNQQKLIFLSWFWWQRHLKSTYRFPLLSESRVFLGNHSWAEMACSKNAQDKLRSSPVQSHGGSCWEPERSSLGRSLVAPVLLLGCAASITPHHKIKPQCCFRFSRFFVKVKTLFKFLYLGENRC